MNNFKTNLLFLLSSILTVFLFFGCSSSDDKNDGPHFPKKFSGTWVAEGITTGPEMDDADTIIIDIVKGSFEVRGYAYTDQVFAEKYELVSLDDGSFTLKNTATFDKDTEKWGLPEEEDDMLMGYEFEEGKEGEIKIIMPEDLGTITMVKTDFKKLDQLKGTWECDENGYNAVVKLENKKYTYEDDDGKYSGTWDASLVDMGDGKIRGILRTITTSYTEGENSGSGLSIGGASPYVLDGSELEIAYPNDDPPSGTTPYTFTKP